MTSDWECIDQARRGDNAAWQSLVSAHYSTLLAQVMLITGDPAAARDIAQDTLTKLVTTNFANHNGSLQGLLSTIAYHLALNERKRGMRTSQLPDSDPVDLAPSPLERVLSAERDREIAAAIRSLDSEHRDVLVLRFYGGHTYEEISQLMNIPLGTVKSRIFYAVKACQQALVKKGILE